jgi:hypothetical protein
MRPIMWGGLGLFLLLCGIIIDSVFSNGIWIFISLWIICNIAALFKLRMEKSIKDVPHDKDEKKENKFGFPQWGTRGNM